MTKLLIIRPGPQTTEVIDDVIGPDLFKRVIGTFGVDFGSLARPGDHGRGLSIIVDEFGLYHGLDGVYCAIGRNLRSGPIIIFAHEWGETVDIDDDEVSMIQSAIAWFKSPLEAAQLMIDGELDRPEVKVNGDVVWQWPSTERPAW